MPTRRSNIARTLIACLAAYALLLHALAMASIIGPRLDAEAALTAQLGMICSGQMQARPDLPASPDHKRHAPACALCGPCGVDMPAIAMIAAPANIIETISRTHIARIAPRTPRGEKTAQPRAPPAFA
jgi:hypothetical protein